MRKRSLQHDLSPAASGKREPAWGADARTAPFSPAVMAVDERMRVMFWDTRMEALTGRSFAEVREEPCWKALGGVGVRATVGCTAECELLHGALRSEEQPTVAMRIPCRSGVCDALVATSSAVMEGHTTVVHVVSSFGARPGADASSVKLTPRQQQVLQLLAMGLPTQDVARELGITVNTARNHIRAVLRELRARSRLEAVVEGRQVGLIE